MSKTSPFSQIASGLKEVASGEMYLKPPPRFADFVSSKAFLGQPPLFKLQEQMVNEAIGLDPEQYFSEDKMHNVITFVWGKGSGKDLVVSYLITYFTYLLLTMRNPRQVVEMAPGEAIDIITVASNQQQANNVLFAKIASSLDNPCMRQFNPQVNSSAALFPQGIRIWSFHSKADSYEGYAPLISAMGEASAFQDSEGHSNAVKVLRVLTTSARSRYKNKWTCFVTSYPRYDQDFIMRLYDESLERPDYYGTKAASWEVRDDRTIADYQKDIDADPEFAMTVYGCSPSASYGKWFNDTQALKSAFINTIESEVLWEPTITYRETPHGMNTYVGVELLDFEPVPGATYVAHGDPALKKDGFSFVIGRLGREYNHDLGVPMVEIVAILLWEPNEKDGISVDFVNVRDTIIELNEKFMFLQVTFDQWNSAMMIQSLIDAGVSAHDKSFSAPMQMEMYRNLRSVVNNRMIRILKFKKAYNEMRMLLGGGNRPDHPEGGSKDVSDGIAAVTLYLTNGLVTYDPDVGDVSKHNVTDAQNIFGGR